MKFVIKKIVTTIITLFLVSFIAFFAFQVIPGDAATSILGTDATQERVEAFRDEMGLNKPVITRYFEWAEGFVSGDLGTSYKYDMPVAELLSGKLSVTVTLGLIAFVIIIIVGIPGGVLAYKFGNKKNVGMVDVTNQVMMAIPSFVMGIFIILIFGLLLKWFIPGGYVSYEEDFAGFIGYLIAPAFAIAIPKIAMVIKFLKSEITKQMKQDYVRTAKSKGMKEMRLLFVHVLKNAMMPVITLLGMVVAEIMAGSIVVEQVFNIPGMGRTLISSIGTRDYPVVQDVIMYIAILVIVMNLIVDLLYKVLDPRVK